MRERQLEQALVRVRRAVTHQWGYVISKAAVEVMAGFGWQSGSVVLVRAWGIRSAVYAYPVSKPVDAS